MYVGTETQRIIGVKRHFTKKKSRNLFQRHVKNIYENKTRDERLEK